MRLEPIDRLAGVRDDHSAIDHLAGRTVVGGNGGGEAYVLDGAGNVLVVPYIGSERDAIPQGSFSAFLRRQAAGTTFDR